MGPFKKGRETLYFGHSIFYQTDWNFFIYILRMLLHQGPFIDDITFEVKGLGREVKPKSVVGGRIYDDKF